MSRIARRAAEAAALYRALPPAQRQRFERGLVAAREALETSDTLPKPLRDAIVALLLEVGGAFFSKDLGKVALALASEWPELYQHVRELLPPTPKGHLWSVG